MSYSNRTHYVLSATRSCVQVLYTAFTASPRYRLMVIPRLHTMGTKPPPSLGLAELFTLLSIAPTTRLLLMSIHNPAQTSVFDSSLFLSHKLTSVRAEPRASIPALRLYSDTCILPFGLRGSLSFQVA